MAWNKSGDKPLSGPMMAQSTDTYMCQLSLNELTFLYKFFPLHPEAFPPAWQWTKDLGGVPCAHTRSE